MATRITPRSRRRAASALALLITLVTACSTSATEPIAASEMVDRGRALFTSEGCVNCHGEEGQGLVGPRLRGGSVLETFPVCYEQVRWVSLGSARWKKEVGSTYGATSKPVRGGMPSFGSRLSSDQIMELVVFTRTVFGGSPPEEAVSNCSG